MNEQDWDEVAATFDEDIFSLPANDRLGLIQERVRRAGGEGRTAADLGCGIGRTLPLLSAHFSRVHAFDISSECLAVAERRCEGASNIHYQRTDLAAPEAPLPIVDLALCINVLLVEQLARRQAMLATICASVAPAGELLLTAPSLESALYASHRLVRHHVEQGLPHGVAQRKAARDSSRLDMGVVMIDGIPTKHYVKEELEDVLRAEGMAVTEILKVEYPWSMVFPKASEDMRAPLPWNWLVMARHDG